MKKKATIVKNSKKKTATKAALKKKCIKKPEKPPAPDNVRICKRKTENNQ